MAGEEHFSQASHTPFASGPVADILGPFEFNEVSTDSTWWVWHRLHLQW
jgi:hypothetical protein